MNLLELYVISFKTIKIYCFTLNDTIHHFTDKLVKTYTYEKVPHL